MRGRHAWLRAGWVLALVPAVLSVVAAFTLGSMRPDALPNPDFRWSDKVGHFVAFGFIQITHARALRFILAPSWQLRHVGLTVVSATACGGLLELWQALLPYRTAEWADFVADGAGAAACGVLYWMWTKAES